MANRVQNPGPHLREISESDRLKTFSVKTPSGGFHYFFYTREQIGNRTDILEGIDTRGKGGYVVGAGSNIDGNAYVILNDSANC